MWRRTPVRFQELCLVDFASLLLQAGGRRVRGTHVQLLTAHVTTDRAQEQGNVRKEKVGPRETERQEERAREEREGAAERGCEERGSKAHKEREEKGSRAKKE
ncbi:hypothetical protein NDU88_008838 [Pleurodeles waltl]|uniref:Uncharacterized protein n=1 Tax=Pleurodeles waltl TaxID=8319 RepID=A0AAV7QRV6_PLEWA|nr:hypothetical protein NDU88_008838 [Pleurodeles waltl]